MAKSLIVSGQAKNILVVTSDTYSKFIQKNNVNTRILFGDGSASTLVSSKKKHNSYQVHSFAYGTDGSGYKNAIINNFGSRYWHNPKKGGESLHLDGPGIYDFALKTVPTAINEYLSKNNILLNKIDYFIFHQANEYIIKNLQLKLQIPNKKILMNMSNIGNTGASSIPIVLHKHLDKIPSKKNLKAGDFEEWDSLGHLNFLLSVEKIFKMKFSMEEMIEIKDFDEISKIIKKKAIKNKDEV